MNTIRSVGYGWGVLIVAGAGSYYFAKRSINADRAERAAADEKRRQTQYRLEAQEAVGREASIRNPAVSGRGSTGSLSNSDHPSPIREVGSDPAPTSHVEEAAPTRGKYEASEPFRSRKGDRFS